MDPTAYQTMAQTEDTHWWFCARRAILKKMIDHLQLTSDARILEIGSGTGGNLRMLKQFGSVSAIEMDSTARTLSMEKYGDDIDIRGGYFPHDNPFREDKFDLICLFDVLEHIENDESALMGLRDLLADDGKILLTVPAYPWMWSTHDTTLHHKRRYTRSMLQKKITEAGFHIQKLSYFNTLLFPLAVLARLIDKLFSRDTASGTDTPRGLMNALLKNIFMLEHHLLNRINLPFGVSFIAIIENSAKRSANTLTH
ncbi:MAG: class I SAM-dependent methyltransferase [Pseudomonadota bacterium]